MIIFDWDGTLCDSVGRIVSAMQAAAEEVGISVPSTSAVRNVIGLGLPQALLAVFPSQPQPARDAMASAYARHYSAISVTPPELFPGALEVLQVLRARGFELAVATGKSRRGLDEVLLALGLDGYFDATRCADETRSKPDPLMLTELLSERTVAQGTAVMVGDSEYDLEMAANAGVPSVGVSFGVHSVQRLEMHRPVAIVDTLQGLLELPCCGGR